ncbi:MAG: molybdenum cofactor guanylyltransferase [Gemmatimonadetes bacterium]|nr:molybdenum cofactor guanylyltransferase [Gemmatimonadota bacterium]
MAMLGAVLAGGESRRFGSDKAAALVGGRTLVERAATTLAEVFPDVVVVSSGAPITTAWPYVADLRPGEGPLAGIEAALHHAAGRGLEGAFVLACDLPLVDADVVRAVVAALGDGPAAAPGRAEPPGWEPLCAAYRLPCLRVAAAALDRGVRSAHRLLEEVQAARVAVPSAAFLNVNTPPDHARALAVLEGEAG